jgi:hypothetical protein
MEEQTIRVYNQKTKEVTFHKIEIHKSNSQENGNILWTLKFHKTKNESIITKANYLLISALEEIRLELEKENKLVVVRGADRDCGMSGMHADMTAGASVSKHEMHEKLNKGEKINPSDYVFHVFDETKIENVTTVKLQKKVNGNWFSSAKTNNNKTNMKKVWKYELKVDTTQEIEMPINSEILSVGVVKNIGYLWVRIEKDNISKKKKIKLLTIPTGIDFQEDGEFIGTLLYNQGEIVQHVFII